MKPESLQRFYVTTVCVSIGLQVFTAACLAILLFR